VKHPSPAHALRIAFHSRACRPVNHVLNDTTHTDTTKTSNVAVEGAPAREARWEPKSDALRRSPRTAGSTAACKAPPSLQCTPKAYGSRLPLHCCWTERARNHRRRRDHCSALLRGVPSSTTAFGGSAHLRFRGPRARANPRMLALSATQNREVRRQ
jgi:hypothetical protein